MRKVIEQQTRRASKVVLAVAGGIAVIVLLCVFGIMAVIDKASVGLLIVFVGFALLCVAALGYDIRNQEARLREKVAFVFMLLFLAATVWPLYYEQANRERRREWRRNHPNER